MLVTMCTISRLNAVPVHRIRKNPEKVCQDLRNWILISTKSCKIINLLVVIIWIVKNKFSFKGILLNKLLLLLKPFIYSLYYCYINYFVTFLLFLLLSCYNSFRGDFFRIENLSADVLLNFPTEKYGQNMCKSLVKKK
jgi:hypothetical protein